MPKEKVSVYNLLRKKYPAEECVLLEEVSDTTGGRNRSCDFMVVNLWKSRGLSIIGIEQKSYRSDWLNEMKNPKKQEAHFKYCDYFYLLTTEENVAKLEEIPVTWGWMMVKGGKIHIMKPAPKLSAEPIPRDFLCAMLRRAADKTNFIHKNTIEETINERVENSLKHLREYNNAQHISERLKKIQQKVDEFELHSGIKIDDWMHTPKQLGQAVRMLRNVEFPKHLANQLANYKTHITGHIENLEKLHNFLNENKITPDADEDGTRTVV